MTSIMMISMLIFLVPNVNYFAKQILKIKDDIDLVCMSSWVTMNSGSDYAQDHIHASSMISGVLYLDAPPGSAPINFHGDLYKKNTFGTFLPIEYSEQNQFNSNNYRVDVESGIIVLFPSNLTLGETKFRFKHKKVCYVI